jgi:mannonate dehydratase
MRFAEIITEPQPVPFWRMLKQLGVNDVVGVLPRAFFDWRQIRHDPPWGYAPLAAYQEMVQGEGLHLEVIEDNPPMEAIRFGRPGRDEEIENVCTLLRNMGRLGIPLWCYNWAAGLGWIRTSTHLRGRGDAIVSGYDHKVAEAAGVSLHGTIEANALWENLRYFLERILPVAEESEVRIAMHPDDPPVIPTIRGIERIMGNPDAFHRLLELVPSEANGITLCQGNFTLMTDDLPAVIRDLGSTGRVFFVHFRDVRGTPESFVETFHDEGKTDLLACMRAYREVGFDGVMRSDHTPLLADDTAEFAGYSVLGRLHAIGYMQGLREAAFGKPVAGDE